VQVYEILRPKFPNILDVMQQIPNISPSDIQKLDEKISTASTTKGNKIDKAKKDLFKKITGHLVGRNVGQLFRKEIKIMNLPPVLSAASRNNSSSHLNLLDQEGGAGLTGLFSSTTTHS
jgi:exportin-5